MPEKLHRCVRHLMARGYTRDQAYAICTASVGRRRKSLTSPDRDMQAKRILKDVDVRFISLVDKGANRRRIIWKNDCGCNGAPSLVREVPIRKIDEEKRLVYGIVYAPDEVDAHGDMMTADEIEKAAYRFMQARRTTNVDKQHDFQADEGFVAESWIVRQGDPVFPDEKPGAWAVAIKVLSDETWQEIKEGKIQGISLAGVARVEEVNKSDGFLERLKRFLLGKDFERNLERRRLLPIVEAFMQTLWQILDDEEIADKESALIAEAEKFIAFLQQTEEEMAVEKLAERFDALQARLEAIEKALRDDGGASDDEALEKQLDERLKALEARLEAIEKASPGRKSVEGRTDDQVRGIRFL